MARDGCNRLVPVAVSVVRSRIVLALEGGEPGDWTVRYRAVSSVDGHQTGGRFQFTVEGPRSCGDPEPEDEIAAQDNPGIIENPDPPGGGPSAWPWFLVAGALLLTGIALWVQKIIDPRVAIALVVLGLVVLGGSFTFLRGSETTTTGAAREVTGDDPDDAVLALCAIRDEEDLETARNTFQDRVHGPLHDLVTVLQDDDRELAAGLLVAKQGVENELSSGDDLEQLVEDTRRLIAVTGDALQTVGMEVPKC